MSKAKRIQDQIDALQIELKDAMEYEKRLESGSPIAIAELLHTRQCHANHIDMCGWEYETWEKPGYSRTEYFKKAEKLLANARGEGIEPQQLIRIISWF